MSENNLKKQRIRRLNRVRKKVLKDRLKLRLSVFRSNKHLYAQIIDDVKGKTLVSVSEKELETKDKMTKVQKAEELGKLMAKKAKEGKIKNVVFDKGMYRYHGRVRSFADGARKEGLIF